MSVGVIVPAAGRGERLGEGPPKALRLLAGEPVLVHAVRTLRGVAQIGPVVVAAPADRVGEVERVLALFDIKVVAGGDTRGASVSLGLAALPAEVDLVLVHDAARCLTPPEVITAVIAGLLAGCDAVVPVLPVVDTIKRVEGTRVLATLDRSALRGAQTPQGFRRDVLAAAHAGAAAPATDDAGLVEALGATVSTVAGSELAFKVTTAMDLLLAEAVLRARG